MTTLAELRAIMRELAEEEAREYKARQDELHALELELARRYLSGALEGSGLAFEWLGDTATAVIEHYQVQYNVDGGYRWTVSAKGGPWIKSPTFLDGSSRLDVLLQTMDAADDAYLAQEADRAFGPMPEAKPAIEENAAAWEALPDEEQSEPEPEREYRDPDDGTMPTFIDGDDDLSRLEYPHHEDQPTVDLCIACGGTGQLPDGEDCAWCDGSGEMQS